MGRTTAMSARSLHDDVIAKRWESELEFFGLENPFLYDLIAEYFTRLSNRTCITKFKHIIQELSDLEIEKIKIESSLKSQMELLAVMAEDKIPENIDSLSEKQIRLENLVNDLITSYKKLKLELFAVTEIQVQLIRHLLFDTPKVQHLSGPFFIPSKLFTVGQ